MVETSGKLLDVEEDELLSYVVDAMPDASAVAAVDKGLDGAGAGLVSEIENPRKDKGDTRNVLRQDVASKRASRTLVNRRDVRESVLNAFRD